MKMTVHYTDGTIDTVNVVMADRVIAERDGVRMGWGAVTEVPQSYLTLQTWYASRRSNPDIDAFDDWINAVSDIEIADGDDPKATAQAGLAPQLH